LVILAATDFSTRSNRALRQAGLLARLQNAQLAIVHVVDDDQPQELVELEKREAERVLAEQISAMPELQAVACRPMITTGDPFDGILRTAASTNPQLIVMGTHRRQLLRDIFVGTTVERVVRTGPFPVLMVNNEAQKRYERILVPVEMSEPSASALRVAHAAGLMSEARTTLLHAFLAGSRGKMFAAGANQVDIESYVADERQRATDELAAFLVANDLVHHGGSLRVEEGGPAEVISRVVGEMRPDLLIMGTHARSGLLKALVVSVTEEALRSLNVDILAVPPVRR
jgi:nucleotide-binding universal stress UspA family protein